MSALVVHPAVAYTRGNFLVGSAMQRWTLAVLLFTAGGAVQAQTINCASVPRTMPLGASVLAPVASELVSPSEELGTAGGVLARAYDESQSVDIVLLRMRIESCKNVATVLPAPSVVDPLDPATYKPRTQYDNAPWRFDMTQNGKRMTADEFDAWMKAKGVRVVKARLPSTPTTSAAMTTNAPAIPIPAPVTPTPQPGTPPGTLPAAAPAQPAGTP